MKGCREGGEKKEEPIKMGRNQGLPTEPIWEDGQTTSPAVRLLSDRDVA